jgi:hypothetical protein
LSVATVRQKATAKLDGLFVCAENHENCDMEVELHMTTLTDIRTSVSINAIKGQSQPPKCSPFVLRPNTDVDEFAIGSREAWLDDHLADH